MARPPGPLIREGCRPTAPSRGLAMSETRRDRPAPDPFREGVVHVWRFALDADEERLPQLEAVLIDEERARAHRFRGAGLKRRFVTGRATLRAILGAYLSVEPSRVVFTYGLHGKPVAVGARGLEFNLAHSGGIALCALTPGSPLGVDVEALRPMENAERIIARYFTPREQADFLSHAAGDRQAAFYRGWTRKEAFLKATGEGLAASLDSFEVDLGVATPGRGSLLLRVGDDPAAAGRWTLRDVEAGPGLAAALAVEGRIDGVVVRDWAGPDGLDTSPP